MKSILKFITLVTLSTLITSTAYSHPGRTASDGCHYCRTNCAQWGEKAGVRHCHNHYHPSIINGDVHSNLSDVTFPHSHAEKLETGKLHQSES